MYQKFAPKSVCAKKCLNNSTFNLIYCFWFFSLFCIQFRKSRIRWRFWDIPFWKGKLSYWFRIMSGL